MIALRQQRHNLAKNRLTPIPPRRVLRNDTRTDLDLHTETENTGEDGPTGDAALEVIDF